MLARRGRAAVNRTQRFLALLWLFSGVPVGLALILLPPSARLVCFWFFVFLETGHSLSPIVLAWTHKGFRERVIYRQPQKFLLLPGLFLGISIATGVAAGAGWTSYEPSRGAIGRITSWDNPLPVLVWFYLAWNLYHFAMQDFGVLVMCTGPARRLVKRLGCLVGLLGLYFAANGMNVLGLWQTPGLIQEWWVVPMTIGILSVNHWAVDVGLSAWVSPHHWLFLLSVLALGGVGFLWITPTPTGLMIHIIPFVIGARLGLGFVHFLYSRWVWQMSDPQVRATIGRDLFRGAVA